MQVELLVRPLNGADGRCGPDMIFSSEFDAIQEARRFDDPSLAQGEWVRQIKEAEWDKVIRECQDILLGKSKDLRVAAWLTEARGKTEGLRGLAEGYRILTRLCEIFWEDIHPLADDELEERLGPLDWLLNQTAHLIRETPLTHSSKGCFSLLDQESARTAARNIERNPELAAEYSSSRPITLEGFDATLRDTPANRLIDGHEAAKELKAAMSALQTALDHLIGQQAPFFGAAFEALDDVIRFFQRHVSSTQTTTTTNPVVDAHAAMDTQSSASLPAMSSGLLCREQAIRNLREIADFFRRTEPHSPVAYLADKAAHWGSMPLHEWLRAVVKDDAALSRMEELLGVEQLMAPGGER